MADYPRLRVIAVSQNSGEEFYLDDLQRTLETGDIIDVSQIQVLLDRDRDREQTLPDLFSFRDLHETDYNKGIIELLSQLTTIDKSKISQEQFSTYVQQQDQDNTHIHTVVERNGRIIATATLIVEQKLIHNLSCVGHIEDVVVDRDVRGVGIGKKLIHTLVEKSKSVGCYKVILDCDSTNVPFYKKCGFKQKGVEMAQYF